jgi:CBS domain
MSRSKSAVPLPKMKLNQLCVLWVDIFEEGDNRSRMRIANVWPAAIRHYWSCHFFLNIYVSRIFHRFRPEMTRLRDVMTAGAIFYYDDQDIAEASLVMERNLVHRLVVLDRNANLVGIVSLSDLAAKAKSETLSGYVLGRVAAA